MTADHERATVTGHAVTVRWAHSQDGALPATVSTDRMVRLWQSLDLIDRPWLYANDSGSSRSASA